MQVLNQEAVANLEKYWVSMAAEGAHSFTESEIAALHPFPQALQPGGGTERRWGAGSGSHVVIGRQYKSGCNVALPAQHQKAGRQ